MFNLIIIIVVVKKKKKIYPTHGSNLTHPNSEVGLDPNNRWGWVGFILTHHGRLN